MKLNTSRNLIVIKLFISIIVLFFCISSVISIKAEESSEVTDYYSISNGLEIAFTSGEYSRNTKYNNWFVLDQTNQRYINKIGVVVKTKDSQSFNNNFKDTIASLYSSTEDGDIPSGSKNADVPISNVSIKDNEIRFNLDIDKVFTPYQSLDSRHTYAVVDLFHHFLDFYLQLQLFHIVLYFFHLENQ